MWWRRTKKVRRCLRWVEEQMNWGHVGSLEAGLVYGVLAQGRVWVGDAEAESVQRPVALAPKHAREHGMLESIELEQ
jgi:hypothetical protein